MRWRLHAAIFSGLERLAEAKAYLLSMGDQVQVVSGRHSSLPPVEAGGHKEVPFLAITTLQDARLLRMPDRAVPVLYWDAARYDVSYWMPRVGSDIPVLNRTGLFYPLGMLLAANKGIPAWLGIGGAAFVKPDKGHKQFTGFTAPVTETGLDLTNEYQLRGLAPELMCLIAPASKLAMAEWRFWIVNRKVVAWSPYSWSEPEMKWEPAPAHVQKVAEAMARNQWQPDIAYVVDIAMVEEEPFLLEINAASTSGVYDAPLIPLLSALRDAAHLEMAGELTVLD